MHIECMVMHDVQNESLIFFYQLGTLSPLPSGEKEVSQTPHYTVFVGDGDSFWFSSGKMP